MARADISDGRALPAEPQETGLTWLGLLMLATPVIWGARLVANFTIASQICFPDGERLFALPARTNWVWPTLLAIDLIAIAIAALTIVVSYTVRRRARAVDATMLLHLGEGRTRFLAIWGLIIGIGFLAAVLYDIVPLLVVPICA